MHSASEAFHAAVYSNSPEERILMRFADGTFFSNEDIQVSGGVTVTEAINYEEELTIGTCLSSTLEATIINDHRLLSGYTFGDCEVLLGVRTNREQGASTTANCQMITGYGASGQIRYTGHSTAPYLRANGASASIGQPTFPVYGLAAEGDKVYCIGADGEIWTPGADDAAIWGDYSAFTWADVSGMTWGDFSGEGQISGAFMRSKLKKFAGKRRGVTYDDGISFEFAPSGAIKRFEYVPLGVFRMDIPKRRRTDYIDVQSYDRMIALDVDAEPFLTSLTFPMTMQQMLAQLCTYVGVELRTTGSFINSDIAFGKNPITKEDVICRDILGWIAQAACAVARMTRDGALELAWFGEQDVVIATNQTFDIDVTELYVGRIDALQIASPSDGIDVTAEG